MRFRRVDIMCSWNSRAVRGAAVGQHMGAFQQGTAWLLSLVPWYTN